MYGTDGMASIEKLALQKPISLITPSSYISKDLTPEKNKITSEKKISLQKPKY